jgi:transcriptional regulator with XRE-family HTH domain
MPRRFNKPGVRNAHFLRVWREAAGLSLQEMAEFVGVHKSVLSKVEAGKNRYYQDVVEMYARRIGCSTGSLLDREPSAMERRILREWAALSAAERQAAAQIVEAVADEPEAVASATSPEAEPDEPGTEVISPEPSRKRRARSAAPRKVRYS